MIPSSSMHYPAVCPYFHPASLEMIPCYQTKQEEHFQTKRQTMKRDYITFHHACGFFLSSLRLIKRTYIHKSVLR
jgi:hypothetical protein